MASKRVTLKWRRCAGGGWKASVFAVFESGGGPIPSTVAYAGHYITIDGYLHAQGWRTIKSAKRACEKLATRILGAMKS